MERPKEGNLYKTLNVLNKIFHIYYGYNSNSERELWDPSPIYPNFLKEPQYTDCGKPYTRADQDVCEHHSPKKNASGEMWCNDCKHFQQGEELIGVCKCEKRKRKVRKNE